MNGVRRHAVCRRQKRCRLKRGQCIWQKKSPGARIGSGPCLVSAGNKKDDTLARALKHKQKRKPRTRIARRGSRLGCVDKKDTN